MQLFLATLILIALAFFGMALGVVTGRRKSSCACKTAEQVMARTTPTRHAQPGCGPAPIGNGPQLAIQGQGCGDCGCGRQEVEPRGFGDN